MKRRLAYLLFAQLVFSFSAWSFTPESGFYNLFTSDANGREGTGLAVELQNDYLFAAGFVFLENGTPTYVTIEGPLKREVNGNLSMSNAEGLASYSGGQCIGTLDRCPYRTPTPVIKGGFSLEFSAENEGKLTWGAADNQASVTLRRGCIGSLCYDAPSSLLGEWDVLLDHPSKGAGLNFGGDILAITEVSPKGDARAISGCVAISDKAALDCTTAQKITGFAQRCTDLSCMGYKYQLQILANNCSGKCKIVRAYRFSENGHGGAFGWGFHGQAGLCPSGASNADACFQHGTFSFAARRSGSVNLPRTGTGIR